MGLTHVLRIAHVNDTHDEWLRAASLIRQKRRAGEFDLLLHGGDACIGGAGGASARILDALRFDAVGLGNHELDDGPAPLALAAAQCRVPLLCANVAVSGAANGAATGLRFRSHRILRRAGLRVAVCGVTLGDMINMVGERRVAGLVFSDPAETLRRLVPRVRSRADIVIVLSHCGITADRRLARDVGGIDLIVGAHCHTLLPEPERVGGTWIVQAGDFGSHVGWVNLTVRSGNGAVEHVEGGVRPTAGVVPDPYFERLLQAHAEDPGEVVGYSGTDLRRDEYARETPVGNFVLDAIRAYAGTELAMLRCSTFENSLPVGPIRRLEAQRLCGWGGDLVARTQVSGSDLLAMLERGAKEAYFLLTLSGAQLVYDFRPSASARVASVLVAGTPLDPQRRYTLAVSEGMAREIHQRTGAAYEALAHTIGDVVVEAIRAEGTIRPAEDGRMIVHGTPPPRKPPPVPIAG